MKDVNRYNASASPNARITMSQLSQAARRGSHDAAQGPIKFSKIDRHLKADNDFYNIQ
jgi:hypothetical protein